MDISPPPSIPFLHPVLLLLPLDCFSCPGQPIFLIWFLVAPLVRSFLVTIHKCVGVFEKPNIKPKICKPHVLSLYSRRSYCAVEASFRHPEHQQVQPAWRPAPQCHLLHQCPGGRGRNLQGESKLGSGLYFLSTSILVSMLL